MGGFVQAYRRCTKSSNKQNLLMNVAKGFLVVASCGIWLEPWKSSLVHLCNIFILYRNALYNHSFIYLYRNENEKLINIHLRSCCSEFIWFLWNTRYFLDYSFHTMKVDKCEINITTRQAPKKHKHNLLKATRYLCAHSVQSDVSRYWLQWHLMS